MQLTFENTLNSNATNKAKIIFDQEMSQQQQHHHHQMRLQLSHEDSELNAVPNGEFKMLKKQQKISATLDKKKKFASNKPTVAALLSAVYEKTPPLSLSASDNNAETTITPDTSASINLKINNDVALPMEASLLESKHFSNEEFKPLQRGTPSKKNTSQKLNNKLKDYFKGANENNFMNKTTCKSNSLQHASLKKEAFLSEMSTSNNTSLEMLLDEARQLNNKYYMLEESLLFKKKIPKINKKAHKELMNQEKKLKKKSKLLEALATKDLKQKKKKHFVNEEETNHLVFEISGDDGFYAQSKDINSNIFYIL